jgi:hypothetical protein
MYIEQQNSHSQWVINKFIKYTCNNPTNRLVGFEFSSSDRTSKR